ncbi:MAG TPA: outer membrane beta-barrel protein [Flavisolibacter sp.]|nr:outer membrane beta-barrel protein [Flavisolibacter sp.]
MKMKKITLVAALLFAGLFAVAQSGQIRAGVNLANVSVTDNGRVNEGNQLTSFQVGLVGDIRLGVSPLSLQSGILYTGKGSKLEQGTEGQAGYFKQTFNPRYLEVPLNLLFKAPLGGSTRLFAGAGPYAAVGIGGNVRTEGRGILGQTYSREADIRFSDDDPTTFDEEEGAGLGVVRRFDYGVNGTAGIEGRSYVLGVNYGHGLAKLQSGTSSGDDNNNKHRVWSITLGFKF